MKRIQILKGIFILTICCGNIYAQDYCKVLMNTISTNYKGLCKNGLADGKGEASGVDQYIGDFKKGYPDGNGTYIWRTGEKYTGEWKKGMRDGKGDFIFSYNGRDSILSGVWKNDKYLGEKLLDPYTVDYKEGAGRVMIMKVGERPYVQLKFSRNGSGANEISNLLMQGSSGSERTEGTLTGFEQVTFPFSCKVRFDAPNAFYASIISCEVRFTINKPGAWLVSITY